MYLEYYLKEHTSKLLRKLTNFVFMIFNVTNNTDSLYQHLCSQSFSNVWGHFIIFLGMGPE